ncbi:hypothetical protein FRB99_006718 [Tulasnella sp. 403]|nr:hypothetical protein FRB99_006718 [Tulasnella sp. 403]
MDHDHRPSVPSRVLRQSLQLDPTSLLWLAKYLEETADKDVTKDPWSIGLGLQGVERSEEGDLKYEQNIQPESINQHSLGSEESATAGQHQSQDPTLLEGEDGLEGLVSEEGAFLRGNEGFSTKLRGAFQRLYGRLLSFQETSTGPLGIQHYADNALNATSRRSVEFNIPKSLSLRAVTPPNPQ